MAPAAGAPWCPPPRAACQRLRKVAFVLVRRAGAEGDGPPRAGFSDGSCADTRHLPKRLVCWAHLLFWLFKASVLGSLVTETVSPKIKFVITPRARVVGKTT